MKSKALLVIVAAFLVVYLAPVSGGPVIYAATAVVVVALMLATLFARTLRRHDDLHEWMALELNKVRRMYHLGKNLGESDHLRAWFTELHGYVYTYLMAFDDKDFSQYQETNADFRKLSYHVYQIPELTTDKEHALYKELLDAAGVVAGARQRIKQLWEGRLPRQVWGMIFVMSLVASAGVLLSLGAADRPVAVLVLSVIGIGTLLVWEMDHMKTISGNEMTSRYVENVARLELSRDREKKVEMKIEEKEGLSKTS